MTNETANSMRHLMALYYAYGRQDGSFNHAAAARVDPVTFAEFYLSLWEDFARGASSHVPSVQDAWDRFRRMRAS